MPAWATREQARQHWADANSIDDTVLDELLEIAAGQCAAYAPAIPNPSASATYRLASIYQARELSAAGARDAQDVVGFGDYAIRARPLTATVKALLRPQRGMPKAG